MAGVHVMERIDRIIWSEMSYTNKVDPIRTRDMKGLLMCEGNKGLFKAIALSGKNSN